ncbi:N-acetyltransferase [Sinomicrobium pectinilyticum]|uniref:N-acetyltransferase n=1 Tax=Sinomicrobium pectinilyticum TaxID=1084421 RepID=A0A3N0ER94_SINP1|nr:GNAT family N-acetyltransferase [Sinomicrobium pectinilyticum]RNL90322.1 N-acetyltransferase [Sinomicrobium pectinilyticum]
MNKVFPRLETERLILGKIKEADISVIVKYAGNKKIAENTLNIPHPYTKEDAKFWVRNSNKGFENGTQFTFGIRIKPTNEFIGGIGLKIEPKFDRAEMGYWIAEKFWNNGFATEAVKAVLAYGFNGLKLNKILATHLVENSASGKVMIKNRMIKEGELKEHTKKNGVYQSLIQFRLTRTEFNQY